MIVTGGAGFIGSNLTLALQEVDRNAQLTVVDDFRSGAFRNLEDYRGDVLAVNMATADLTEYFNFKKVKTVYHLASITDTTDHDQQRQVHDNVESFRNLLRAVAGTRANIVYASSAATYGVVSSTINRLDDPPRPANVYAFSKVILDNMARRWAKENPKQRIVGLRYFNVYGPRETHKGGPASMIYHLAQQMKARRRPRIFKHGQQKRDFVYVRDIVGMTLAAAKAKKSGIYNAGTGRARSFNDLVECLNKALGMRLMPEYIENPHAHYQPHTQADIELTLRALGYQPQYTLEAGIADYLKSGWLV